MFCLGLQHEQDLWGLQRPGICLRFALELQVKRRLLFTSCSVKITQNCFFNCDYSLLNLFSLIWVQFSLKGTVACDGYFLILSCLGWKFKISIFHFGQKTITKTDFHFRLLACSPYRKRAYLFLNIAKN
jgi:hypothetical protein